MSPTGIGIDVGASTRFTSPMPATASAHGAATKALFQDHDDEQWREDAVEIVAYDREWPSIFDRWSAAIAPIFGSNLISLEHFGSTAVPGLVSRPVIDMMALVREFPLSDSALNDLRAVGFDQRRNFGPELVFLGSGNPRTCQLVIQLATRPEAQVALINRDYLRTHDAERDAYGAAKQSLAASAGDALEYLKPKHDYLNMILRCRAAEWHNAGRPV